MKLFFFILTSYLIALAAIKTPIIIEESFIKQLLEIAQGIAEGSPINHISFDDMNGQWITKHSKEITEGNILITNLYNKATVQIPHNKILGATISAGAGMEPLFLKPGIKQELREGIVRGAIAGGIIGVGLGSIYHDLRPSN